MPQENLLPFLRRISWILSLTTGAFFAFLICDLLSSSYGSGAGAENFFEWGWIWMIVFMFIIKKTFLSENFITNLVAEDDYPNLREEKVDVSSPPILEIVDDDMRENAQPLSISEPTVSRISEPLMEEKREEVPKYVPPPEPEEPSWIVTFFSDRPLAKIGGIILFLGAFFFLSLIWTSIGSVGKILLGILFGFSLYGIGIWMDGKGHTTESRTLLGVGIAVNMLTILSGRWIIGDASGSIFSDTVTLIFLLLNTLFAVATGLVYNSKTFLIFSFIFAYIIPFLVRSESDSVILMMLYVFLISSGGYLLTWIFALRNEREEDMRWLFRVITVGTILLFSLNGFGVDTLNEFILSVSLNLLLTVAGVFISKNTDTCNETLPSILISAYIMLACSLFGIGEGNQATIFITFFAMVPLMVITGIFMVGSALLIFSWLLLVPLIFGLILLSFFGIGSLVFILLPIVCFYGISGFFLLSSMVGVFQYVFFIAIGTFLFICSIAIGQKPMDLSDGERFVTASASLLFFFLSLWSGQKYKITHIALVSLISSSLIFFVTLIPQWNLSWIFYILFLLMAFVFPFFQKDEIRTHFTTSISYQVVMNLFMIGELFYLGRETWFTGNSSSLITLGIIVFILSVVSLMYSWFLIQSSGIKQNISTLDTREKGQITALLGIPLSLFSLAIAVTFSESPLVVSTAWILESTILAYYSQKEKSRGLLIGTIILGFIGTIRLIPFFDTVYTGNYLALVPIFIIAIGLYFSVSCISKRNEEPLTHLYYLLHIFGIVLVAYAMVEIIPHTGIGWSLIGISIFLCLSTWFYVRISSQIISFWMASIAVLFFFYHLARMDSLSMTFGPILIQMSALLLALYSVWYMKAHHPSGKYVFIYAFIMFSLITSLYVNNIFNNVFAVTIYLTIVATMYLLIGINDDIVKLRTIGLYIGIAVLIKILFYDIWAGVDNLIIRVVALMTTGGIMIAISQLYGRRVNRSWREEFAFDNFFSGTTDKTLGENTPEVSEESYSDPDDIPFDGVIAEALSGIDITHIASIELRNMQGDVILLSKRSGIIRMAKYITTQLSKDEFASGELEDVLENVIPHIQSLLPKRELENLLLKIHNWIRLGGKIVINKKN